MIDTLRIALERLLERRNVKTTPLDELYRELIDPTLQALEAYHDEGAAIRQTAMGYLDAQIQGKPVDQKQALQDASDFLQAKAREFEPVRVKYLEFHAEGEALGYFEGAHEPFFVAVMQYLHLIQLDGLAYIVAQEREHVVDLDKTLEHVHSEIDNSFYLLDHGLQDVRACIADVLLGDNGG